MTYSFCESATVTGVGPWHIRKLSEAGHKYGGGIDTPSLCTRVKPKPWGGWDLRMEVTKKQVMHVDVCQACRKIWLEETKA